MASLDPIFIATIPGDQASAWWQLVGRLHVVLVHFPIALLLTAALLEAGTAVRQLTRRGGGPQRRPGPVVLWLLVLGAISLGLTTLSGWTYADLDWSDDTRSMLTWHRWLGVAAAVATGLVLLTGLVAKMTSGAIALRLFRLLLFACAALVGVEGHFGGALVHGSQHLLEPFRARGPAPGPPPIAEVTAGPGAGIDHPDPGAVAVSFHRQVQPLLAARCVECHGPDRKKGGLRLDTREGLLGSDDQTGVVIPGDPSASELVRRLHLPEEDSERMPRKGPPLAEAEIGVLVAWIAAGANVEPAVAVGVVGPSSALAPAVTTDLPLPPAAAPVPAVEPEPEPWPVLTGEGRSARDAALAALQERGAIARVIAAETDAVEVSLAGLGKELDDGDLGLLSGLETSLVWLDLAGTGITDDALKAPPFVHLRRLSLQRTAVTDAGLPPLAGLPRLEVLNLHSTAVTDTGLQTLRPLRHLKRLYLWQTRVTPTGAANLRAGMPAVETILGE